MILDCRRPHRFWFFNSYLSAVFESPNLHKRFSNEVSKIFGIKRTYSVEEADEEKEIWLLCAALSLYFSSTIKLTTNHSPTTQNITSHRPEEAPRVAIDLCGPAPQSISSGESLQRLSGTSFLWSLQLERLECTAHTDISCRFALNEAISRARGGSQRCIPGPHTGANSNPPISWHCSRVHSCPQS